MKPRRSRRCAVTSSSTPTITRSRTSIWVKVAKRADGKFQTEIAQKIFTNYADPHVALTAR